ncbi:MAG: DUF6677 family protein [Planctomycetota bacterium]
MAKVEFSTPIADGADEVIEIDLKNRWLAGALSLVVPGLGHLYQGRTGKGVLFMACVLGTFLYGLYIGGGKVVYASVPGQKPYRWQYLCQAPIGLAAAPAYLKRNEAIDVMRQRQSGRRDVPWVEGFMAPPSPDLSQVKDRTGNTTVQPNELAKWNIEYHPFYEVGSVYTMIAGLLNLLVICDAMGGPLVIPAKEKPTEDDSDEDGPGPDAS